MTDFEDYVEYEPPPREKGDHTTLHIGLWKMEHFLKCRVCEARLKFLQKYGDPKRAESLFHSREGKLYDIL